MPLIGEGIAAGVAKRVRVRFQFEAELFAGRHGRLRALRIAKSPATSRSSPTQLSRQSKSGYPDIARDIGLFNFANLNDLSTQLEQLLAQA